MEGIDARDTVATTTAGCCMDRSLFPKTIANEKQEILGSQAIFGFGNWKQRTTE
jgi:hypothetical protein